MKINQSLKSYFTSFDEGMKKGSARCNRITEPMLKKAVDGVNTVASRIKKIATTFFNSLLKFYDRIASCFIIESKHVTKKESEPVKTEQTKPITAEIAIQREAPEVEPIDFKPFEEVFKAAQTLEGQINLLMVAHGGLPLKTSLTDAEIKEFARHFNVYLDAINNIDIETQNSLKNDLQTISACCSTFPKTFSKETKSHYIETIVNFMMLRGEFPKTLQLMTSLQKEQTQQATT